MYCAAVRGVAMRVKFSVLSPSILTGAFTTEELSGPNASSSSNRIFTLPPYKIEIQLTYEGDSYHRLRIQWNLLIGHVGDDNDCFVHNFVNRSRLTLINSV